MRRRKTLIKVSKVFSFVRKKGNKNIGKTVETTCLKVLNIIK